MASFAQPPLGEPSSAYQGALYTFGLTGYGVNTPAHEAGPFLPVTPFPGGMRQRTTQILHGFPRQPDNQSASQPETRNVSANGQALAGQWLVAVCLGQPVEWLHVRGWQVGVRVPTGCIHTLLLASQ